MEEIRISNIGDRRLLYRELIPQLRSLVSGEDDVVANLANISAALKHVLSYASWAGFYLMKDGELVVGPFQGKVACTRIKIGSGVCGKAAEEKTAIIVPDVNRFPGHIACDAESKSEIVVPLLSGDQVLGVLDLDSTNLDSFNEVDREVLGTGLRNCNGVDNPEKRR